VFSIKFPYLTVEFISNLGNDWNSKVWLPSFHEFFDSCDCQLDVSINNKRITLPDNVVAGYIVGYTLKNINNAFCLLLLKGEATVIFNRPDYLKMKLASDKILFTNEKIRRPELQMAIKDEPTDLFQAVEEVLRVKKEYKKICIDVAKAIKPNDIDEFMSNIIVERDYNESYIQPDEQSYYWINLFDVWSDYKKQHNITDEDVKRAIAEEEEKDELLRKKKRKWWKFS